MIVTEEAYLAKILFWPEIKLNILVVFSFEKVSLLSFASSFRIYLSTIQLV